VCVYVCVCVCVCVCVYVCVCVCVCVNRYRPGVPGLSFNSKYGSVYVMIRDTSHLGSTNIGDLDLTPAFPSHDI
jgi:hypothetical protein